MSRSLLAVALFLVLAPAGVEAQVRLDDDRALLAVSREGRRGAITFDDGTIAPVDLTRSKVGSARLECLELRTDAPYVSRDYRLFRLDADGQRTLLSHGRLSREPGDARPIEIAFDTHRVWRLELRVADGDDAPLVFRGARVSIPSPTLFLAAPDGDYRILVGDPSAGPPETPAGW